MPLPPSGPGQRINGPAFEAHTGLCPGAVGVAWLKLEAPTSLYLALDADFPPEAAALEVLVTDLFFVAAKVLALSSDAAVGLLASSNWSSLSNRKLKIQQQKAVE